MLNRGVARSWPPHSLHAVAQVLTTQYTDVPERRALKLMMAREKSRLAGEQQRHMLVLRRISERMGTYARSTNTVHRKLRKIHETLAEALAMFGVESSVLSEACVASHHDTGSQPSYRGPLTGLPVRARVSCQV